MSPRLSPHRLPAGSANWIASALLLAIVAPVTVGLDAQTQPAAITGPTNVTVTNVNIKVVGTTTLSSSGRLAVAWSAPTGSPTDHYEIQAIESRLATTVAVPASATSATLSGLKASTTYSIVVKPCHDSGCVEYGEAASVSGTTSAEYWQVQGAGASAATATLVVPNVMAWPLLYGAEAGSGLQGKVRLYYKYQPNVSVALSTGAASAVPASVASFTTDANHGGNSRPRIDHLHRSFGGVYSNLPS